MKDINARAIITPKNEFLEKKQELFNLYLKMPVQFNEDWKLFRKHCKKQGFEFEDVLGNLIIQFNKGKIGLKGESVPDGQQKE
ncbi:MAG: hypothetical protein QG657_4666 [Acidobacteriota bacterium]|nr:hypothetical protein [Acidobacteriota bacterium]